jgi:hypothetical protein
LDTTPIRGNENQINNRTDNSINRQQCNTETLSRHNLSIENMTHRQSVLYTGQSWEGIFDCEGNSGENESSGSIDEIDFSALFEEMDEGN